ncbi:MAG: gliding motility-associated C-terminal domain-containing protein [Bacteroidia bacterium]
MDNAGLYQVTVTNRCGIRRDTVRVDVAQPPYLDLGADTVICPHISLLLDARIEGIGTQYRWNDGLESGIRQVQKPGLYTLEISNACGSVSDSFRLQVDEDLCNCSAFVPNIFSPNGDGANDLFEIVTECPPVQYEMQIFDRWGELMFHSDDPTCTLAGPKPQRRSMCRRRLFLCPDLQICNPDRGAAAAKRNRYAVALGGALPNSSHTMKKAIPKNGMAFFMNSRATKSYPGLLVSLSFVCCSYEYQLQFYFVVDHVVAKIFEE